MYIIIFSNIAYIGSNTKNITTQKMKYTRTHKIRHKTIIRLKKDYNKAINLVLNYHHLSDLVPKL